MSISYIVCLKGRNSICRRKNGVQEKNVDLARTAESTRTLIIRVQNAEAAEIEDRETTEEEHKYNTIQNKSTIL